MTELTTKTNNNNNNNNNFISSIKKSPSLSLKFYKNNFQIFNNQPALNDSTYAEINIYENVNDTTNASTNMNFYNNNKNNKTKTDTYSDSPVISNSSNSKSSVTSSTQSFKKQFNNNNDEQLLKSRYNSPFLLRKSNSVSRNYNPFLQHITDPDQISRNSSIASTHTIHTDSGLSSVDSLQLLCAELKESLEKANSYTDIEAKYKKNLYIFWNLDDIGNSIFHLAAQYANVNILKGLIEKYPGKWYVTNKLGETAMHSAIHSGNLESFKYLLQLKLDENVPVNQILDHEGNSLLSKAIIYNQYEIVKYLLENFIVLIHVKNNYGAYPIHLSAIKGNITILRHICRESKKYINQRDSKEFTPSMYAAREGHYECLKYLLDNANAKYTKIVKKDKYTLLHLGVKSGSLDVVQYLIMKMGSSYLKDRTKEGATVFHIAAASGNDKVLEYLLAETKLSKLLRVKDISGSTAAHDAAEFGHVKCLKLLYDAGLSMFDEDIEHATPFSLATQSSNQEMIDFAETLKSFANENQINSDSNNENSNASSNTTNTHKFNLRRLSSMLRQRRAKGINSTPAYLYTQRLRPAPVSLPHSSITGFQNGGTHENEDEFNDSAIDAIINQINDSLKKNQNGVTSNGKTSDNGSLSDTNSRISRYQQHRLREDRAKTECIVIGEKLKESLSSSRDSTPTLLRTSRSATPTPLLQSIVNEDDTKKPVNKKEIKNETSKSHQIVKESPNNNKYDKTGKKASGNYSEVTVKLRDDRKTKTDTDNYSLLEFNNPENPSNAYKLLNKKKSVAFEEAVIRADNDKVINKPRNYRSESLPIRSRENSFNEKNRNRIIEKRMAFANRQSQISSFDSTDSSNQLNKEINTIMTQNIVYNTLTTTTTPRALRNSFPAHINNSNYEPLPDYSDEESSSAMNKTEFKKRLSENIIKVNDKFLSRQSNYGRKPKIIESDQEQTPKSAMTPDIETSEYRNENKNNGNFFVECTNTNYDYASPIKKENGHVNISVQNPKKLSMRIEEPSNNVNTSTETSIFSKTQQNEQQSNHQVHAKSFNYATSIYVTPNDDKNSVSKSIYYYGVTTESKNDSLYISNVNVTSNEAVKAIEKNHVTNGDYSNKFSIHSDDDFPPPPSQSQIRMANYDSDDTRAPSPGLPPPPPPSDSIAEPNSLKPIQNSNSNGNQGNFHISPESLQQAKQKLMMKKTNSADSPNPKPASGNRVIADTLLKEMQNHKLYNTKKDYILNFLDRSHKDYHNRNNGGVRIYTSTLSTEQTVSVVKNGIETPSEVYSNYTSDSNGNNQVVEPKPMITTNNNQNQNSVPSTSSTLASYERFPYLKNKMSVKTPLNSNNNSNNYRAPSYALYKNTNISKSTQINETNNTSNNTTNAITINKSISIDNFGIINNETSQNIIEVNGVSNNNTTKANSNIAQKHITVVNQVNGISNNSNNNNNENIKQNDFSTIRKYGKIQTPVIYESELDRVFKKRALSAVSNN